jgi:pimeloyl-ACP methyl ester carboxylesterase
MPKVSANGISLNYEVQGTGEPVILIPYLAADHACYAFQVAEYAKHFRCVSIDPRGAGESDKPAGSYSTELFADDVAAFMQAVGIDRAHVAGLSLGAAVGMWLAAKHPERVLSLSLHSAWTRTDPFVRTIVESWQLLAKALGNVQEMVILGIFPWCFTPELYTARPEYIESLSAFVRSRPAQPVDAFLRQSEAVVRHDVESQLGRIVAPTLLTFGRHDALTSLRFADPIRTKVRDVDLLIFEDCAHAALYQSVEEFNQKTLAFLQRHRAAGVA